MKAGTLVWGLLAFFYAFFFTWYTSWGGPLTADEIEHYVDIMRERGRSSEDIALLRRFMESDTGDDFAMVNAIELRRPPTQVEGVRPGDSAEDVMDEYMEYMLPAMLARASHPVFMGRAANDAMDVWGIRGAESWSMAGLVRYRSRRDILQIATNPAFGGRHEFKQAAMLKTVAFPVDPWFHLGDPRLVLALLFLVLGLGAQSALGRRSA